MFFSLPWLNKINKLGYIEYVSGPNILIARLATKVAKPNGQHYVSPDKVEEFIRDVPVKNIPGNTTLDTKLTIYN